MNENIAVSKLTDGEVVLADQTFNQRADPVQGHPTHVKSGEEADLNSRTIESASTKQFELHTTVKKGVHEELIL